MLARTLAVIMSGALSLGVAQAEPTKAKAMPGVLMLYAGQQFDGQSVEVTKDSPSLSLDMTVGSIAVYPGETWELCQNSRYRGTCLSFDKDETKMGKVDIKSARNGQTGQLIARGYGSRLHPSSAVSLPAFASRRAVRHLICADGSKRVVA